MYYVAKNWLFEPCLIYVQICSAIATAVQTYNIVTGTICIDSAQRAQGMCSVELVNNSYTILVKKLHAGVLWSSTLCQYMYALYKYYYQVFELKYLHTMHVTKCEMHILDSIVSLMGFQNYVYRTTRITYTM